MSQIEDLRRRVNQLKAEKEVREAMARDDAERKNLKREIWMREHPGIANLGVSIKEKAQAIGGKLKQGAVNASKNKSRRWPGFNLNNLVGTYKPPKFRI